MNLFPYTNLIRRLNCVKWRCVVHIDNDITTIRKFSRKTMQGKIRMEFSTNDSHTKLQTQSMFYLLFVCASIKLLWRVVNLRSHHIKLFKLIISTFLTPNNLIHRIWCFSRNFKHLDYENSSKTRNTWNSKEWECIKRTLKIFTICLFV